MNEDKHDIPLEGITKNEVLKIYKNEQNKIRDFNDFYNSHRLEYVLDFYSQIFCKNRRFINNVHLSDLLQLYYIDFNIKRQLTKMVLRIERWLNTSILNLYDEGEISKGTDDSHDTFYKVIDFYKKLEKGEQKKVYDRIQNSHGFNISFKEFCDYLHAARYIRNFSVHHFSTLKSKYKSIVDDLDKEIGEKGKNRSFSKDIKCTISFFSKPKINEIYRKIKNRINKLNWSEGIEKIVLGYYKKKIFIPSIIDSLSEVKRSSLHQLLKWKDKK